VPADVPPDGGEISPGALDCQEILSDAFERGAPAKAWTVERSPTVAPPSFFVGSANLSLPAGADLFSVLSAPPFRPAAAPLPDVMTVNFRITVDAIDETGVTIAQLLDLTGKGAARVAAAKRTAETGEPWISLVLIPIGSSTPVPGTIDISYGGYFGLSFSLLRMGNKSSFVLMADGGSKRLTSTVTGPFTPEAGYFQMGPRSDRGSISETMRITYDNVHVRACTYR
jgi:hypothetical protein